MRNNKLILLFSFFFFTFFFNCNSQKSINNRKDYKEIRQQAFKEFLKMENIVFNKLNDSIYSAYYLDFMNYESKQKLEKNPFIKINKVYVHYRTPTSVEFSIYSDRGTLCLSTFDLDIDRKILSFPENGVIKVLEPIQVEHFGTFEIQNNIIKTRKRRVSPYNETYYYVNGTIKNDTIHYTEKYIGRGKKFEKKLFAKTRKSDIKEIYQPNLKAKQYKIGEVLVSYEVTGEFTIEK